MRQVDWTPYPWPATGVDPFDPTPADTCWVAARNGGLSRAFPAGDWLDWGDWGAFATAVPMGYSDLVGAERLVVARDGRVVGEWAATTEPPEAVGYHVRHLDHLPRGRGYWRVVAAQVTSYDEARAAAAELSMGQGGRAVVTRTLRSTHWH